MKWMPMAKLLAGAAVAAMLSGAAYAQEIKVWHHGGRGDGERDTIARYVEEWNKANPDKQAVLEILPEGAYNEQVQAAAAAGKLPDLLDFDGPNYANYVWSGYLEPLNDLMAKQIEDATASIVAQGTYAPDSKVYSLGQHDSGLGLWASKSMLEKAKVRIPTGVDDAWTLAEFEAALKALKDSGVATPLDLKMNYGKGEWYTYGFSPIVQSMGGDLIDRKTWKATGTINGEAAVKALTAMQGWVKAGYVVPAAAGDDAFYGKKTAAISLVGHWMWPAHSKALGDDLLLLPMPKWGDKHATGNGSWCWGITKTAKNKEAAAAFLAYLLETDRMVEWSTKGGHPPASKSATAKSDLYKAGGKLSLYADQLGKIAVARPAHPAYPVITAAFAQAVQDAFDGANVQEALDKAAKAIDQNIEDNSGYPPFGG